MTDFQKYALAFCVGFFFVVTGVASFLVGRAAGRNGANLPVKIQTDTLIVRDTIREKYPAPAQSTPKGYELVKAGTLAELRARISALEAAAAPDTVEVQVPIEIERRIYEGDDYRAVVEGWRPQLAEIAIFPKTIYLQTEVTQPSGKTGRQPRLGFGVTLGPSVIWVPGEGVKAGAGGSAGITIEF